MRMTAQLVVFRRPTRWRDRLRPYRVFIDESEVGVVWPGAEATFDVPEGNHTVVLKIDWAKSNAVSFSAGPHEQVRLVCDVNRAQSVLGGALKGGQQWINLTRLSAMEDIHVRPSAISIDRWYRDRGDATGWPLGIGLALVLTVACSILFGLPILGIGGLRWFLVIELVTVFASGIGGAVLAVRHKRFAPKGRVPTPRV